MAWRAWDLSAYRASQEIRPLPNELAKENELKRTMRQETNVTKDNALTPHQMFHLHNHEKNQEQIPEGAEPDVRREVGKATGGENNYAGLQILLERGWMASSNDEPTVDTSDLIRRNMPSSASPTVLFPAPSRCP
jgi:hypothetical protein